MELKDRGAPAGHQWEFRLHWEAETQGRRDESFDIDRAWIQFGHLTFGRIHPWDVSGNPESERPWGLLAQSEAQNRGILLGEGFSPGSVFPEPVTMGWIGASYWSDPSHRSSFEWGVSASPVFEPSMGSEVSFSQDGPTSYGRFARRPPGFVQVNGALLPLGYQIDTSRVLQDVVLQPQLMAQAHWRLSRAVPGLEGWLSVSRAPSPDPAPDTSGYVNVTSSGVEAVAQVTPRFPERWVGSLANRWKIPGAPWGGYLFGDALASNDGTWGYEVGAGCRYFSFSFLNQPGTPSAAPSPTAGMAASTPTSGSVYADDLLQAESTLPLWASGASAVEAFGGIKKQLRQDSVWIRSGARARLSRSSDLEAGFDLFGGGDSDYFGEWRTNDRVFVGISWRLGPSEPPRESEASSQLPRHRDAKRGLSGGAP